jgi:putative hydrolase of the HAD superfamily
MITTVVFYLDDTLYDEVEYCKSGFSAVAGFLSDLPQMLPADYTFNILMEQFKCGNRTKTFNAALEQLNIIYNDELIGRMVKVYREHKPKITLPQDSREVLALLQKKYNLALLTDGFLPGQELKVKALDIENYFKCIIYTEKLGREFWKPSPAGFKKITETLKVKPQTAIYVADNEAKDFIAPNKLGWITIRLIRPARAHTSNSTDPGAAAKHVIREIRQLPDLIARI